MFVSQLNRDGAPTNMGLSYSIELRRDDKIYMVDSRFAFRSGDKIRFHVRPNVDGYMYILLGSENGGGNPALMFPRPGDENNVVRKGQRITIPEKGTLTFDRVPGVESLKLVLSTKPLETKPAEVGRGIIISEKKSPMPSHFSIDFAAFDPEIKPVPEGDFETNGAATMVSMQLDKPLVVDLLLRHDADKFAPDTTVAMNARDGAEDSRPTQSTPGERIESLSGSSPVTDKWAVVIGISNFKNSKWNLHFPDKDANDFAKFLVDKCNFAPDHVRVLTNAQATRERILTDIGSYWLPYNAKPNDLVCIYFATHGTAPALDIARRNFLMAYDTDPLNPYATGIEINDLARNVVRRLQSQRVVLILDTCHSGAAEPGAKDLGSTRFNIADLLQGTGNVIIASAAANQIAHDSARYKNGIFTKHLMDGLGKYDKLSEAFSYTRSKVQEESLADYKDAQTPVLKDADWKGVELKISVPPIKPRKPIGGPPI